MNWGTKLVVAMALFMGFIIALSVRMILSDKDDLVEKDYYEKGLAYDHDYVRKQNVERDHAEPVFKQSGDNLEVHFKTQSVGSLNLRHATDRKRDRSFTINTDNAGDALISLKGIDRGSWQLTFEWKSVAGRSYLYDKEFFVQ